MRGKALLLLLFILLSGMSAIPSLARAESYLSLRKDYQQLTGSTEQQRLRMNWEHLLTRFDRYIAAHPLDSHLDRVLFLRARTWDGLARASGSQADSQKAIDRYLDVVERFPGSYLADDALFQAGQAAEQRHDEKNAARHYQRLLREMPAGDMAPKARQRLAALGEPATPDRVAYQHHDDTIGAAPQLEGIRYWSGPEYTRVVLDLNAPVVSEDHLLSGSQPRLYFDLLYVEAGQGLNEQIPIRNGLVKQVRTARFDSQRLRVVIDLNRDTEYRVTNLTRPDRLVVDILGPPAEAALEPTASAHSRGQAADDSIATLLDASSPRQPALHVPQQKEGEGIRLVVVDAGHGGRDPGAVGPSRVYEKDVVLNLAQELARELRQQLGVEVLMTRSDDRYIELRERTAYANRVGADLFISLHANASPGRKAYGVETYFLNLSKNNQAAEVAARENGTSLQEVDNLEAILFDLMANAKINESSRLAAEVQQSLVAGLRPHYSSIKDLGVKQGPFHVLLGATMPSVLVEAAFISHPREEKRLKSSGYRRQVARAITQGVKEYAETVDKVVSR